MINAIWPDLILLLLGALVGGFVNGMTGFGTALAAMPIWLQIMPPASAGALGAAAGITGQAQSMHLIWHAVDWRRAATFIIPGLLGVPLGTWLLPLVDLRLFKLGVGVVLVVYCGFHLVSARLVRTGLSASGGAGADMAVGFCGGVMSGLAGLSGPLPVIWATFKPWARDEKRALFQVYNSTILLATLVSSAAAGLLPLSFLKALILSVPATLIGVRLGMFAYSRLDDRRFDRIVIGLMFAMGVSLVIASI